MNYDEHVKCLNIKHAKMHNHLHTQWKQTHIHSGIQHVHHNSLNIRYDCRNENSQEYLSYKELIP